MKQLARLKSIGNAIAVLMTAVAFASLLGVTLLPGVLGYKTYVVLSGSMEPAIHTGSVLVALPVAPESLKVNDVIVYNRSDVSESVTHRIIQVDNTKGRPTFTTKGDANGAADSWSVEYNGNTAGKIVLAVPLVGYAYHAIGSPQGRLVFLVVPVVGLSLMWLAQIWRPANKMERVDREVPRSMAPEVSSTPLPTIAAATPNLTARADPAPLPLRQ